MSHETYEVNSPPKGSRFRRDGSYRSFILILVCFLLLCLIIIFFGNLNSIFPKKSDKTNYSDKYTDHSKKENVKEAEKDSDKDDRYTDSPLTTPYDEWMHERENKSKEFKPKFTTTEANLVKLTTSATTTITTPTSTITATPSTTTSSATATTTPAISSSTTITTTPSSGTTTTTPSSTTTTNIPSTSISSTITTTPSITTSTTPSTNSNGVSTTFQSTTTTTTTAPSSTTTFATTASTTTSSAITPSATTTTTPSSTTTTTTPSSSISSTITFTPSITTTTTPSTTTLSSTTNFETSETSLNLNESSSVQLTSQVTQSSVDRVSSSTESGLIQTNSNSNQTNVNDISTTKDNSNVMETRSTESTTASNLDTTNSGVQESVGSNSSAEVRTSGSALEESESTSQKFTESSTSGDAISSDSTEEEYESTTDSFSESTEDSTYNTVGDSISTDDIGYDISESTSEYYPVSSEVSPSDEIVGSEASTDSTDGEFEGTSEVFPVSSEGSTGDEVVGDGTSTDIEEGESEGTSEYYPASSEGSTSDEVVGSETSTDITEGESEGTSEYYPGPSEESTNYKAFGDETSTDSTHGVSKSASGYVLRTTEEATTHKTVTKEAPGTTSDSISSNESDYEPIDTEADLDENKSTSTVINNKTVYQRTTSGTTIIYDIGISTTSTASSTAVSSDSTSSVWTQPGYRYQMGESLKQPSDTCNTHQCKTAALEMYAKMDQTQAPCQDFYAYSCGRYGKVKDDSNEIWDAILYEMAKIKSDSPNFLQIYKHFYEKCVDFQFNIEYSQKLDEVINVWKAKKIHEYQDLDIMDIEKILALLLSLKSMHFMDIGKGIDRETGDIVLQLKLPEEDEIGSSVFRSDLNHCLSKQWQAIYNKKNYQYIFEEYSNCLKKNIHFENTYKEALGKVVVPKLIPKVKNIYKMLEDYPSLSEIDEQMTKKNYSTYSIAQLNEMFTVVSWEKLFTILLGEKPGPNFRVQVFFEDYFHAWFKKFQRIYVIGKQRFLAHIAMTDMYYNYAISRTSSNVETYCQKLTADTFKDISSYIYSKNVKNNAESQSFVHEIFEEFKSSLKTTFSSPTYVEQMGTTCSQKIDNIKLVFNSLDGMATVQELTAKYSKMKFYKNETFIEIIVAAREFQMKNLLKSKHIFGNLINAYDKDLAVFYESNNIYVPYGFLSTIPQGLPRYINIARVGIHVAKALAKFFDPTGMPQIVTESSLVNYKNIFASINPTVLNPIEEIQADSLLNEAIADNTACRLLTDSVKTSGNNLPWLDTYPGNKHMFYIAVAQEFCEKLSPMEEARRIFDAKTLLGSNRVNNMMANSKDFARTFECIDGTNLNSQPHVQFPHIPEEFL